MVNVAVGQAVRPFQVEDVLDTLQVHGQTLKTVGDLTGNRFAVDATDLLEIGELGDFHAVHPDFPAEAPGAERRVLPVILDKADIVLLQVEAEGFQRAEIEVENVVRRRFEHDLILIVVLHAVGVLAITTVLGAARGLNIGGFPGLGAERAQKGRGVAGAGADFHIVGLEQGAPLFVPVTLETQNDFLKCRHERREKTLRRRKNPQNADFTCFCSRRERHGGRSRVDELHDNGAR